MRLDEGVGVDRYEQIGLHPARLLDPALERDQKVAVPGEQRTHVRLDIDQALKFARDRQGDVLFAGSTPSPGTRILPAVPWIDHDRDETIDDRPCGFLRRLRLLVVRLGFSLRLLGRFSVRGFPEGLPHFQLGFLQQCQ